MNDFEESSFSLGSKLVNLLPLLLIAAILVGLAAFGITTVMPKWQTHGDMQTEIAANSAAVTATASARQGEAEVLNAQMISMDNRLADAGSVFLTSAQADSMLDKLYVYAKDSQVEIVKLELQPAAEVVETAAYSVRTFSLEVSGKVTYLMQFMVRIKEASAPSLVFGNVAITESEQQATLTMDLLMYVSPYASGTALDNLPEHSISTPNAPTPTPLATTPAPQVVAPTATEAATETAPDAPAITATPTSILPTPAPTLGVTPTPGLTVMGPGIYEDASSSLHYTTGSWIQMASVGGSGGSYHYTADTGASVELVFAGTDAVIQYVAFSNFGIFEISVDGVVWGEVDTYAENGTFGQTVAVSGLPYSIHTLTIRNTGRKNAASEGTVIALDSVQILQPNAAPTG
jgi:hypothetical protein